MEDVKLLKAALIKWCKTHPKEYIIYNREYALSPSQLIWEIENETKVAISLSKSIIALTINLLTKGKEHLD